jgi:hypothetical protein
VKAYAGVEPFWRGNEAIPATRLVEGSEQPAAKRIIIEAGMDFGFEVTNAGPEPAQFAAVVQAEAMPYVSNAHTTERRTVRRELAQLFGHYMAEFGPDSSIASFTDFALVELHEVFAGQRYNASEMLAWYRQRAVDLEKQFSEFEEEERAKLERWKR